MDHMTEKRAQYVPYSNIPRTEALKREPELKLEGSFECQPEYRKAYIDYLIRERLDRKPRPLDNLGCPAQRAFEFVPTATSLKPPEHPKTPTTAKTTAVPPTEKAAGKEQEENKGKPQHRKSLSKIENCAFGPKLTVPSTPRQSRSTSPAPPGGSRSRRNSCSGAPATARRRSTSRFNSAVKVENLATRSRCSSPAPPAEVSGTRSRWQNREANAEKSRAFVVLENNKELNNNSKGVPCDGNANIYKEQRWMSPWYNPSS